MLSYLKYVIKNYICTYMNQITFFNNRFFYFYYSIEEGRTL